MELLLLPTHIIITFFLVVAYAILIRRGSRKDIISSFSVDKTRQPNPHVQEEECQLYKDLYFKLHNFEHHPHVLPEARALLLSLFSKTLQSDSSSTILSLEHFSPAALDSFVRDELESVTKEWRQYLARRRQGQPRELFPEYDDACQWLVRKAPHKLVDGAWLGHVHRAITPFRYRRVTKAAWQVFSEELGDGDLDKCHTHVYSKLLQQIGIPVPAPNSAEFIQHNGMDESETWLSALSQLLISLFSQDFFPEMLGFNLHFEMLTLDTLMAAKELREVGIDPYYFTLHITIDNADTGHTAMASRIVAEYLKVITDQQGAVAAGRAWKRVQAGFILSKNLHQISNASLENKVLDIFSAKSLVSDGLHDRCSMTMGGQTLSTWLNPTLFRRREWQLEFLRCLGNSKPLVYKGKSSRSLLIRHLSWRGCMFGAFTDREVAILREWIDSLELPGPGLYMAFTDRSDTNEPLYQTDQYPKLDPATLDVVGVIHRHGYGNSSTPLGLDMARLDVCKLLPLWFAQVCLLETFVSIPWNAANDRGCAIVRILRAQHGFLPEPTGVDGIDEMGRDSHIDLINLGLEMLCRTDPESLAPEDINDVLERWPSPFARTMLAAAAKPHELEWVLLGMTQAFIELHVVVAASDSLLSNTKRDALRMMAAREQENLSHCVKVLIRGSADDIDFAKGYSQALREIRKCFE